MAVGPGNARKKICACVTTVKEELSFYSKATTDFEFLFPFGWGELWGVADRTDYDLNAAHLSIRARAMDYFDPETNEHYIPYVVEPSLGADRVAAGIPVRRLR